MIVDKAGAAKRPGKYYFLRRCWEEPVFVSPLYLHVYMIDKMLLCVKQQRNFMSKLQRVTQKNTDVLPYIPALNDGVLRQRGITAAGGSGSTTKYI